MSQRRPDDPPDTPIEKGREPDRPHEGVEPAAGGKQPRSPEEEGQNEPSPLEAFEEEGAGIAAKE